MSCKSSSEQSCVPPGIHLMIVKLFTLGTRDPARFKEFIATTVTRIKLAEMEKAADAAEESLQIHLKQLHRRISFLKWVS